MSDYARDIEEAAHAQHKLYGELSRQAARRDEEQKRCAYDKLEAKLHKHSIDF